MTKSFIPVSELECALVWDGTDEVRVPKAMGVPRADQMQGEVWERLAEVAGRVSYDSMGKGRSSVDFHKHIADVGHFNVYEHHQKTVVMQGDLNEVFERLANRPGVWSAALRSDEGDRIRITFNKRAIMDWQKWSHEHDRMGLHLDMGKTTDPIHDEEKWISIFVQGSRGFSHELVRHRFRTAVSQRSTRYVDESASPWVMHPLIEKFEHDNPLHDSGFETEITERGKTLIGDAQMVYDKSVKQMQGWLEHQGSSAFQSRKQARGAARGFLGNALLTEMLFSASVTQWVRMLRLRASDAADAEIRMIFTSKILPVLRSSRYGKDFDEFELGPASDGIGQSLVGGGAK